MKEINRSFWLLMVCMVSMHSGISQVVGFVRHDDQIDVMHDGHMLTSYRFGRHLSRPVLYPLMSPSGEMVTRSYPFEVIEGESHDHPHHTGVSFTYGSNGEVNGTSFWANPHDRPPFTKDEKLPQIRQVQILEMREGEGQGVLHTVNHWVDDQGKPVLFEDRMMEFFPVEDRLTIDFTIYLTAVDTNVTFQDTKEGMFAIRVADWLAEGANGTLYKSTGEYLNAEGERKENNIWAKRSAWVRLEGDKDGKAIGVAIFHHPGSVNFPAYWHARGYGCFAANPIGQYDYQKGRGLDNPQHRTLTITPGEKVPFKFRMVVYEGARSKKDLDQEFADFSRNW
jgi:hypothetical protein